jgi:anti-sigma B factor antagonist
MSSEHMMDITEQREGNVVTIGLAGRLDGTTAKAVEERILQLIDSGATRLVVDLGQLDYISSVGLRVFMMAAKRLKVVGGRMVVCALQPAVKEVFEIAGFSAIFGIFEDRQQAVAGVS